MVPYSIFIIGVISGTLFGLLVATDTERRIRKYRAKHWYDQWFVKICFVLLAMAFVTAITVVLLRIPDAYPLESTERYSLIASGIVGAFLGKWFRFLYWSKNA